MAICLPHNSRRLVEDWAQSYIIGSEALRRKSVINGIVDFFSFDFTRLVDSIDFSKSAGRPVGNNSVSLSQKYLASVNDFIAVVEKKTEKKLFPWEAVHFLIMQSKLEEVQVRAHLRQFLSSKTKLDRNQLWLSLDLEVCQQVQKKLEKQKKNPKANGHQNISEYVSQSLELYTNQNSEDELREKFEQLTAQAAKPSSTQSFLFFILTLSEKTRQMVSSIVWENYHEHLSHLVEMAIADREAA